MASGYKAYEQDFWDFVVRGFGRHVDGGGCTTLLVCSRKVSLAGFRPRVEPKTCKTRMFSQCLCNVALDLQSGLLCSIPRKWPTSSSVIEIGRSGPNESSKTDTE